MILGIIAGLLQPPAGRSGPGNPDAQMQIMRHDGLITLLNCCIYDDHNRFARERVQLCLKWLMDGCEPAKDFLRGMVTTMGKLYKLPGHPPPGTNTLWIDGLDIPINVQVRSPQRPRSSDGELEGQTRALRDQAVGSRSGIGVASGAFERLRSFASSTALSSGVNVEGTTLPPFQPTEARRSSALHGVVSVGNGEPGLVVQAPESKPAAHGAGPPGLAVTWDRMRHPEELLQDIIGLANEAARLTLGHESPSFGGPSDGGGNEETCNGSHTEAYPGNGDEEAAEIDFM